MKIIIQLNLKQPAHSKARIMATKTAAQTTPKLQKAQKPQQSQQLTLTNGANEARDEALVDDFLSFLRQAASHGGFRRLQGLWEDHQVLEQKYENKRGAYTENLLELSASAAMVREKDSTISSLENGNKTMKEKLKSVEEDRDQNIENLRLAKNKAEDLTSENGELQRKIKELEKKLEQDAEEIAKGLELGEQLKVESEDKAQLKGELERLGRLSARMEEYDEDERDKFHDKLEKVFKLAYGLAEKFLFQDIEIDGPTANEWTKLMESNTVIDSSKLPLPMTNSLHAKWMRFGVGLYVLAFALTKHVFQPIYISEDQDEAGRLLTKIENRDQEVYVRSVLLALSDKRYGQARARKAAQETLRSIKLFVPPSLYKQCEEETIQVCLAAFDVWSSIQHLTELVIATFKHTMAPTEEGLKLPEPPLKDQADKAEVPRPVGSSKGGSSKTKSGGNQNRTRTPPDLSGPSPDETVYYIWPQFSTTEETIYPPQFLTMAQVGPAMTEFRRGESRRRGSRNSNRRNSDVSTTMGVARKNSSNPSFLPTGNGDGSSKA